MNIRIETSPLPTRDKDIFCSPRCGFECTYAAYLEARRQAEALVRALGSGWYGRVHENMGWWATAIRDDRRVWVTMSPWTGRASALAGYYPAGAFRVHAETAPAAVALVLGQVKARRDELDEMINFTCKGGA